MSRISFLFLAMLAVLSSCSKKSKISDANLLKYSFATGINEITAQQYVDTTVSIPLSLNYMSGSKEQITLQLTDTAGLATADTLKAILDYTGNITLKLKPRKAGIFQIFIIAKGQSSEKAISITITVKEASQCSCIYYGNFTETGYGFDMFDSFSYGPMDPHFVFFPGTDSNTIRIAIRNDTGLNYDTLLGTMDCKKGTLVIPDQGSPQWRFNATGTFNCDNINLKYVSYNTYNSDDPPFYVNCWVHMTRK